MPVYTELFSYDFTTKPNQEPLDPAFWTNVVLSAGSALQVLNGACTADSTVNEGYEIVNSVAFPAGQYVEATIGAYSNPSSASGSVISLVVYGDTNNNDGYAWSVFGNGDGTSTLQLLSGETPIFTTTLAKVNVGDVLRLEIFEGILYCYYNGALLTQLADSAFSSGTVGLEMNWDATPGDTSVTLITAGSITASSPRPGTQLFTDNFMRSNEEPLDPALWNSEFGENYSGGDLAVVNQLCVCPTAEIGNGGFETIVPDLPDDQYAEMTFVISTEGAGDTSGFQLFGRTTFINAGNSGLTGYLLNYYFSAGWILAIQRIDADGSNTVLAQTNSAPWQKGLNVIRMELQGSTITAFVNGQQVLQATDSTYSSGTVGPFITSFTDQTEVAVPLFTAGSLANTGNDEHNADAYIYNTRKAVIGGELPVSTVVGTPAVTVSTVVSSENPLIVE